MALTPRQLQLLSTISLLIKEQGYAPSQRQLASKLHCTHRAIQEILAQLLKKGHIKHAPGISRSIQVISPDFHGEGEANVA